MDVTKNHTDSTIEAATSILERIFGSVQPGIRYRLWDGPEGRVGNPDDSFTLVIRDRNAFRRVFGSQNSKLLAEAFVENRLDIEGNLFACLRIANQLENFRLSWVDKLSMWFDLRRV
jgi:hypothetical protein